MLLCITIPGSNPKDVPPVPGGHLPSAQPSLRAEGEGGGEEGGVPPHPVGGHQHQGTRFDEIGAQAKTFPEMQYHSVNIYRVRLNLAVCCTVSRLAEIQNDQRK